MQTLSPTLIPEGGVPLLCLRGVTVAFGGLLAVDGIDLDVVRGNRLAVLGPNGAGKTTLFNAIAGDISPTSGSVLINGKQCADLSSRHRPRLGVARTYQKTRLFSGLSVQDNLVLALIGREGPHRAVRRRSLSALMNSKAESAAQAVWLTSELRTKVSDLSHGQQRQLEVGMAIITNPDLMLLDEPASGLSRGERERLLELLKGIRKDTTLLLIEHDMEVALGVADRVMVMADGRKVVEGTPAEIRSDPIVHQIYLGSRG